MADPASIRYKNPGAMWGNALARKWGAESKAVTLNDGLGQGNNIAVFPDYVHGAAAQFDLWNSHYTGMTLDAAIRKWSGGNSSTAYMQSLTYHTGLTPHSPITSSVLSSPTGLKLMKAQAQWEAGRPYPCTDEDWLKAQEMVFHGGYVSNPSTPVPDPKPSPGTPTALPEPSKVPAPTKGILDTIIDWLRRH